MSDSPNWTEARDRFVRDWGALATAWGIPRTMAQVHALLLVSPEPLSTDDVMDALDVSRGGANTSLRGLIGWGLVHKELQKGERKEFFVAEKQPWKMFCTIARERKRRELEPAMALLQQCAADSATARSAAAKAFHAQMNDLDQFIATAASIIDKVVAREQSKVVPAMLKLFG